jgi:hypothetical protein
MNSDENYDGQDRRTHVDWHLNRSVSLTIIILLLGNITTSIWWASSINSDVGNLSNVPMEITELRERMVRLETTTEAHTIFLNKLNETLENFNDTLNRMDRVQSKRAIIFERLENDYKKGNR